MTFSRVRSDIVSRKHILYRTGVPFQYGGAVLLELGLFNLCTPHRDLQEKYRLGDNTGLTSRREYAGCPVCVLACRQHRGWNRQT